MNELCIRDFFISRFIVRFTKHGHSMATIVMARDCAGAAIKAALVEGVPLTAIEYARAI